MTASVWALTFVTRQKKSPSSSGITGGVKMVAARATSASTTGSTLARTNRLKRFIVDLLRACIALFIAPTHDARSRMQQDADGSARGGQRADVSTRFAPDRPRSVYGLRTCCCAASVEAITPRRLIAS